MQTATVRELRNHYTRLLTRVRAGEEIVITQRGEPVARLIPERPAEPVKINWADSPALTRDRTGERMLTGEEALDLIHEAAGKW
jgi:prevent-host-death family protein